MVESSTNNFLPTLDFPDSCTKEESHANLAILQGMIFARSFAFSVPTVPKLFWITVNLRFLRKKK